MSLWVEVNSAGVEKRQQAAQTAQKGYRDTAKCKTSSGQTEQLI
jgi:hypothetical protein